MSLEPMFTPPGANAAAAQNNNNQIIQGYGTQIAGAAMPGVMNQIKFAGQLEPARQNAIKRSLALATPGMQQGLAERQVGTLTQDAEDAIGNTKQQFAAAGLSAGALGGAIGDINNNKVAGINKARNQVFDPITQARLAELSVSIANGGQQVNTGALNAGSGLAYGAPQVKVGPGFGEVLGGVAGQWAGGGFG